MMKEIEPSRCLQAGSLAKVLGKEKPLTGYEVHTPQERYETRKAEKVTEKKMQKEKIHQNPWRKNMSYHKRGYNGD